MSEYTHELRRTAEKIFVDIGTPMLDPELDTRLWNELEKAEFTTLSVEDSLGGSGGDLEDAAALVELCGYHGARLPLAESMLVGGWLLTAARLPMPGGPLSVASGSLSIDRTAAGWTVSGKLTAVAWGRSADHIAVLTTEGATSRVVLVRVRGADGSLRNGVAVAAGANLAAEPRDDLSLTEVSVDPRAVVELPVGHDAEALGLRQALARSILLCGAGRRVLDCSMKYVSERVQFGRPIGTFQSVQQSLAELAGHVGQVQLASEAATLLAGNPVAASMAIAAAKATASASAGPIAALGHQLHGAIGTTQECGLALVTTRLWSWRNEDGSESYWNSRIGRLASSHGGAVWDLITATTVRSQ